MYTKKQPTCYIIAGPNGAGKTTFALKYLPKITSCNNFINADEIAKGLSPLNSELALLPASKIFLSLMNDKISKKEDFAFETTLSGRSYIPKIKNWREEGWNVVLFYLYIPSFNFSAQRVKERVAQGGHNIPLEDIIRRYPRSICNLFEYAEFCDRVLCLNNEKPRIEPIFEKSLDSDFLIKDKALFAKLKEISNHD